MIKLKGDSKMPSWIVHLATDTAIHKKLGIVDNRFLIGSFIPDATNYVIPDLSISVPYSVSHFSEFQTIEGMVEELPNFEKFIAEYKNNLSNSMVLGYFTHLLTDFYWNKITFSRYTLRNQHGESIGLQLKDGSKIFCSQEDRNLFKHNDFSLFDTYVIATQPLLTPFYESALLTDLSLIKEVPFKEEDIHKIVYYFEQKKYLPQNGETKENNTSSYQLFTEKQIKEDYKNSIEFVTKHLKKLLY